MRTGFRHLFIGPVRIKLRHDPMCARWGWPVITAGPLKLFSHTSSPRCFVVASWHDPASITWSWSLYLSLMSPGESRRPSFHRHRTSDDLLCWRLAFGLGVLSLHRQHKMLRK